MRLGTHQRLTPREAAGSHTPRRLARWLGTASGTSTTEEPSDAQWTDYVARTITLLDTPGTDAVNWFETNKSDGDWRMVSHTAEVPEWTTLTTR